MRDSHPFYFSGAGDGHLQSLILGGTFFVIGMMTFLIGLVGDLINFNRQLIEMTLEKVRRMELHQREGADASAPPNIETITKRKAGARAR